MLSMTNPREEVNVSLALKAHALIKSTRVFAFFMSFVSLCGLKAIDYYASHNST